ncbi:hypothetical protein Z043_111386, partial [Scleropages formosus]
SERTGSYQKRWFVLKGNLLFYQECRSNGSPLGVIVLEGCSIELCESDELFAFSVGFGGHGCGTYRLAAKDQPSQESWIKALLSASHGFLSMLVSDLERRYHEVVSETCGSAFCQQAVDGKGFTPFLASQNYRPSAPTGGQSCHMSQLLQVPPTSRRNTSKISPKLWTKRTIDDRAVNEPAAAEVRDEASGGPPSLEDFCMLHELYGKEVKDLIALRQIMERKDEKDVKDEQATGSG